MSSFARKSDQPLESTLRHRRESIWQIIFPVVLVALLFIGLIVALYLTRGPEGVSIVADFALVFVVLPFVLIGVIVVAAIGGMIYGIHWALNKVPPYTNQAQVGMKIAYKTVDQVMDRFTSVLIGGFAILGGFANTLERVVINGNGAAPSATPEAETKQPEPMRRE